MLKSTPTVFTLIPFLPPEQVGDWIPEARYESLSRLSHRIGKYRTVVGRLVPGLDKSNTDGFQLADRSESDHVMLQVFAQLF